MFVNPVIGIVTIKDEDGKLTGEVERTSDNTAFEFDPLTTLCDLLDPAIYDGSAAGLEKTHIEHPFFIGREYEGDPEAIHKYRFTMFLYALRCLKDIIVEKRQFSMSELEVAKIVFKLKFSYRLEFREEDQLYDLGYEVNPFTQKVIEKYLYETPYYIFDFDIEKLFDEYKDNARIFTYTCYDVKDIIFSVVHYLVLQKYQFNQCGHCNKYFATKTLKNKYCKRKSPYKGYGRFSGFEKTECEQAVRDILQEIRRDIKRIDDHLIISDRENNTHNAGIFWEACCDYREKMKQFYTVENLKAFEKLLVDQRERSGMNKGRTSDKPKPSSAPVGEQC